MEKLYGFLKNFLWANIGVFFGRTAFVLWQYCTKKEQFAMQSAPWYLSIEIGAAFTALLSIVLLLALYLVGRKLGKPTSIFKLGSQLSLAVALCACIWMGFEIYGYHTDYDLVAVEAIITGVCLIINLACAVLRLLQENRK